MNTIVRFPVLAACAAVLAALPLPASGQTACDRACLEGLVDRYLDALVAHDPTRLPLASNVRFTENGVRLDIGDAQWKTVIGKGNYRLFVTSQLLGAAAAALVAPLLFDEAEVGTA